MQAEWASPHDLCTTLSLTPSKTQRDLFDRFMDEGLSKKKLDVAYNDDLIRGVLVLLLWHTLSNPGTRMMILGEQEHRNYAMQFLRGIIMRDTKLAEVVTQQRWSLKIGTDPGWEIRASGTNAVNLQGREGLTVLVLGAMEDWAIEVDQVIATIKDPLVVRMF